MAAIVSDTTALIVLAGGQRLDLLGACFERVLLPQAVYLEWLAGDAAIEQTVELADDGLEGVARVRSLGDARERSRIQPLRHVEDGAWVAAPGQSLPITVRVFSRGRLISGGVAPRIVAFRSSISHLW